MALMLPEVSSFKKLSGFASFLPIRCGWETAPTGPGENIIKPNLPGSGSKLTQKVAMYRL